MARPSLLTSELVEQARVVVARCYSFEIAADLLGINRRTLARWIQAGQRERQRRDKGRIDPKKEDLTDYVVHLTRHQLHPYRTSRQTIRTN